MDPVREWPRPGARPDDEAFRMVAECKEIMMNDTKQLGMICLTILLCAAMILCGVSISIKSDVAHLKIENEKLTQSVFSLESRERSSSSEAKKYKDQYDEMILRLETKLGKAESVVDKIMKMSLAELKKIAEER